MSFPDLWLLTIPSKFNYTLGIFKLFLDEGETISEYTPQFYETSENNTMYETSVEQKVHSFVSFKIEHHWDKVSSGTAIYWQ